MLMLLLGVALALALAAVFVRVLLLLFCKRLSTLSGGRRVRTMVVLGSGVYPILTQCCRPI